MYAAAGVRPPTDQDVSSLPHLCTICHAYILHIIHLDCCIPDVSVHSEVSWANQDVSVRQPGL
jgi:hypothetical protein